MGFAGPGLGVEGDPLVARAAQAPEFSSDVSSMPIEALR